MVAVSICGHSLNTDRKPSMFGDETIPMYGAEDGADMFANEMARPRG